MVDRVYGLDQDASMFGVDYWKGEIDMEKINSSDLEFSKLTNIVTDIESILMKSNILMNAQY